MKPTGNTILIAGGTSGIGLGMALRLERAGNRVIIAGRREELLAEIAAQHPTIATITLDVADPASITALRERVEREHPDTNVLIAMAGIMLAEDLTAPAFLATAERHVEINLLGTIRLIAAFTPMLLGRRDATIMTVSSGLAFVPLPMAATYSATKAAIHSFTQSLRVQLRPHGVEVIELIPPGVRTSLFGQDEAGSGMPLEDFLDEVMTLLAVTPALEELCVQNVHHFRYAERRGDYREVLDQLS